MNSNFQRGLRNSKSISFLTFSGLAATSLGLIASPASATSTFTVTNCNDTGAGSLRNAVATQQTAGEGTVVIGKSRSMSCTEIFLDSGITISGPITIQGSGSKSPSLRVKYEANESLFMFEDLDDDIVGEVHLHGIVFDGKYSTLEIPASQPIIHLGSNMNLDITETRFTDIRVDYRQLFNSDFANETNVSFTRSTVDNVHSDDTMFRIQGNVAAVNTTFFNNSFFEGYFVSAYGRIDFVNNTVVDTKTFTPGSSLLWANSESGEITAAGNIFASTTDTTIATAMGLQDRGGNLIADGGFVPTTDFGGITNTTPGDGLSAIVPVADLKIGTFANHGGMVPTLSLLYGSIAEDYFLSNQLTGGAVALAVDARGLARPHGVGFDVGSFEVGSLNVVNVDGVKKTSKLTLNFDAMSSKLTVKATANIKKFVSRIHEGATNISVTVLGYVQPTKISSNDDELSLSRAFSVKKALKTAGFTATRWNVKGKGKATTTGSKARKVVVTVTYTMPAVG